MVQRRKAEVEQRIVEAAERVFAERGYAGATMGAIAKAAQISTGNVYRYFENKEALFYGVFTEAFADELMRLVDRRVASLVELEDLGQLDARAEGDAESMLTFWIQHRLRVVVLLDRAEGSAYADFGARFVERLVALTVAKLRHEVPGLVVTKTIRFTLDNIFTTSLRAIVSILENHEAEADIRRAFAAFWSYQLAGIAGFEEWVRNAS